jgi:hypothetical protein
MSIIIVVFIYIRDLQVYHSADTTRGRDASILVRVIDCGQAADENTLQDSDPGSYILFFSYIFRVDSSRNIFRPVAGFCCRLQIDHDIATNGIRFRLAILSLTSRKYWA